MEREREIYICLSVYKSNRKLDKALLHARIAAKKQKK